MNKQKWIENRTMVLFGRGENITDAAEMALYDYNLGVAAGMIGYKEAK